VPLHYTNFVEEEFTLSGPLEVTPVEIVAFVSIASLALHCPFCTRHLVVYTCVNAMMPFRGQEQGVNLT
jgi:hypothetical protein